MQLCGLGFHWCLVLSIPRVVRGCLFRRDQLNPFMGIVVEFSDANTNCQDAEEVHHFIGNLIEVSKFDIVYRGDAMIGFDYIVKVGLINYIPGEDDNRTY